MIRLPRPRGTWGRDRPDHCPIARYPIGVYGKRAGRTEMRFRGADRMGRPQLRNWGVPESMDIPSRFSKIGGR